MKHKRKTFSYHYHKFNKKELFIASSLTIATCSLGLYSFQSIKADQVQIEQQTSNEQKQATTEQNLAKVAVVSENVIENQQNDQKIANESNFTPETSLDNQNKDELVQSDSSQEKITEEKTESIKENYSEQQVNVNDKSFTPNENETLTISTNEIQKDSNRVTENTLTASNQNATVASFIAVQSPDQITIGDQYYTTGSAVDVASYQSWMTQDDYNNLKNLGVGAVVVKLTEGTNYTNPYAAQQIKYAQNAGLNVSVYHYATFDNKESGMAEGQYMANVLQNTGLSKNTLIFADMEDPSTYSVDIRENLNVFWEALRQAGYANNGIYTYTNYLYRDAAISTVGKSKTWIAQYPYEPVKAGYYENKWRSAGYGAWQFSSTAYIPGRETMGGIDLSTDFNGLLLGNHQERNEGYFDKVEWDNGVVQIQGWHAADNSETQSNSFMIVYDKTTNRELKRISYTPTKRTDLSNSYVSGIYNVVNSGFDLNISLADYDISGHEIQLIARYSNREDGEGRYTDFWSKPYILVEAMKGNFDDVKIKEDKLYVRGWSVSNSITDNTKRKIELLDGKTDTVLRTVTYTPIERQDVANSIYGSYKNALYSGFEVNISLDGLDISHLYVRSVLENEIGFQSLVSGKYSFETSAEHFDDFSIFDGNKVHVRGWFATDKATDKNNALVILYDKTVNRELGRLSYIPSERNDVASSYAGSIYRAGMSGFNVILDLGDQNITGHELQAIVRYSNIPSGEGSYVERWSSAKILAKPEVGIFDEVQLVGSNLHVRGWFASDRFANGKVASLQLVNARTGQVLRSVDYIPNDRFDVANNGYASYQNSSNSGFDVLFPVAGIDLSSIKLVVKYSSENYAVSQTSDKFSFMNNAGYIDKFYIDKNNIAHIDGWHASDLATTRPYAFIIVYDQDAKQELGRVSYKASSRLDVANSYAGGIYNAGNSGFKDIKLNFGSNFIHGHRLQIITRFTDDPKGDGNYSDIWFNV